MIKDEKNLMERLKSEKKMYKYHSQTNSEKQIFLDS